VWSSSIELSFKRQVSSFKYMVYGRRNRVHRWARALLAVLVGNLAYFAVMPKLPASAQHAPGRLDLGLLLDFCLCAVVFALLSLAGRRRAR
jgi:hypothetical protein